MASLDQSFIKAFQPAASGMTPRMTLAEAMSANAEAETSSTPSFRNNQDGIASREDNPMPLSQTQGFRAQLLVDSFSWPKLFDNISDVAEDQLDQLAAELLGNSGVRRTTLGIAGDAPGVGSTTLLLGVARRLARHGLNLVLMDANVASPSLASRLGLLPEMGWEAVAEGRQPLDEVLIESSEDHMTLLPLGDPQSLQKASASGVSAVNAVGAAMELLRKHYDVVLVDLGVPGAIGKDVLRWVGDWMDAAVLIHDVRAEDRTALDQARSHLVAAGITVVGMAENFVPPAEVARWLDAA